MQVSSASIGTTVRQPEQRTRAPHCAAVSKQPQPQASHIRRKLLLALPLGVLLPQATQAIASVLPNAPPAGSCADCIGEVNGVLNACALDRRSCVSTSNDDAQHFTAPWQYDGDTDAAVSTLIAVATGGAYEPGLVAGPFGRSQSKLTEFAVNSVVNQVLGKPPPVAPPPERNTAAVVPFDGKLVEAYTTEDGTRYVRIEFGSAADDPAVAVDAEFTFLPDDSIVDLRASSRADPVAAQEALVTLSFETGVALDSNVARRLMERLRKALQWELAPVITDFDPRFNNDKPLWFENFFQPFMRPSSLTTRPW